ncbi:MAG TPA: molybdopterin-dependent oxidoreductase [Parasulfuritortus sp.]
MPEVRSTCPYCGVGCGVLIETDGARIVGVRGDPEHPANQGRLCAKGSTLHLSAGNEGRLLYPELRADKSAPRQRLDWDAALDHAAGRFAGIVAEHGPDAVGFYLSGQLLTEDYYVFNKLAKGLIGTNNCDTNSRLCMSSAVSGYKATLGADAPPCNYQDIDQAATLFVAGSNTAYAHPVLYRRIEAARGRNPGQRLIVVDPRLTDTARDADLHLAILPGTDVALFNGMLHVMLWDGLVDGGYIAAHTEGFEALRDRVRAYTPERVAGLCGIREDDLVTAARWFAAGPTLSLYCQGLNQSSHGTDKNAALINLHLATGQIGKPGAGPFSLTGQPNAMGGREVGGLANLLPAHRDLADPEHRAEVARQWGVAEVPERPGLSALELFEAARAGRLKALWIVCTNPAHSLPDQTAVREALERCEFVVVQECHAGSETVPYADLLLPASTWGEKDGTVTNSERRISRQRGALAPPGEARHDWRIGVDFARRLESLLPSPSGGGEGGEGNRVALASVAPSPLPLSPRERGSLFPYESAESVWNEHRETTRGRDLDITGLSYAALDRLGPQQWPMPEGAAAGRARLYEDGRFATASGRARFHAADYLPPAESVNPRFPLVLNTGRLRDHWHTLTRTGRVARLWNHVEEPCIGLNPADLERRGIRPGSLVKVSSRRGQQILKCQADADVRPGQVWLPMHWGAAVVTGLGVNALTSPERDPVSRQPELKYAAVQVAPWSAGHGLWLLVRGGLELAERLRPFLSRFTWASLTLSGRDVPVLALHAVNESPIPEEWLAELDRLAGLDDPLTTLSYRDPRRAISKKARLEAGRMVGVRLTGETAAQDWLKELILTGADAGAQRPWLLSPLVSPPQGCGEPRQVVCNCLNVAEAEIDAAIAEGADLAGLQARLKCGTECGSCLPELKRRLLDARRRSVQAQPAGS